MRGVGPLSFLLPLLVWVITPSPPLPVYDLVSFWPAHIGAPVRSHKTSHPFFPDEVIAQIEAIVASGDEARLADYLTGEAAQTFVDVVHEVCPHVPPLP